MNKEFTVTNGWDDSYSESFNSLEEAQKGLVKMKKSDLDYWQTEHPDEGFEAEYTIMDPDGNVVYNEEVKWNTIEELHDKISSAEDKCKALSELSDSQIQRLLECDTWYGVRVEIQAWVEEYKRWDTIDLMDDASHVDDVRGLANHSDAHPYDMSWFEEYLRNGNSNDEELQQYKAEDWNVTLLFDDEELQTVYPEPFSWEIDQDHVSERD